MKSLKVAIDQAVVENFEAQRADITKDIAVVEAKLVNARYLYEQTIREDIHNKDSFSDPTEIATTFIKLSERKFILADKLNAVNEAYAIWKEAAGLADVK